MTVRFGPFTLDTGRQQLFAGGREVPLSPKAFSLLELLLRHRPNVIDKETIVAKVWFGTHVTDASLTMVVAEIRKALQDSAENPRYVRTAHRRGYAFSGEAEDGGTAAPAPAASAARFWLELKDRRIVLESGDTTIGRDPASRVWLDVPSVSWLHARIITRGRTAAIEDLDSTNGTFVGRRKVRDRTPLRNGDTIRVGEVVMTFGAAPGSGAVRTERLSSKP